MVTVQKIRETAKKRGKKKRLSSVFLVICGTASVLGNEKNKEEIFTLFVIIVLHNIHLLILFIPFEVPQSAADFKIGNEMILKKEKKINKAKHEKSK